MSAVSFVPQTTPTTPTTPTHQPVRKPEWNPTKNNQSLQYYYCCKRLKKGQTARLPTLPNDVLPVGYHWKYVGDKFVRARNPTKKPTKSAQQKLLKTIDQAGRKLARDVSQGKC